MRIVRHIIRVDNMANAIAYTDVTEQDYTQGSSAHEQCGIISHFQSALGSGPRSGAGAGS